MIQIKTQFYQFPKSHCVLCLSFILKKMHEPREYDRQNRCGTYKCFSRALAGEIKVGGESWATCVQSTAYARLQFTIEIHSEIAQL